eukprot:comp15465_c4_seq1/m.12441 comp15465_c4_seq1/g.12441  ORF comp15465_c4_seq1/g.12441 comp15465_c4_seq1/m.12441 type:complete len:102 (-) comp15465_c4_seq1:14-319(-)
MGMKIYGVSQQDTEKNTLLHFLPTRQNIHLRPPKTTKSLGIPRFKHPKHRFTHINFPKPAVFSSPNTVQTNSIKHTPNSEPRPTQVAFTLLKTYGAVSLRV